MHEELRRIPLFSRLADKELQWIAERSQEKYLIDGEFLFIEGMPATHLYVLIEGELQITKKLGGREIVLITHHAGAFTGEVPLLTGTSFIASARSLGPSRLLSIAANDFQQMLVLCPSVISILLAAMAGRIQATETLIQQNEKLAGLGKLSAGLAHELNNPAAAGRRSAEQLRATFQVQQTSAIQLNQQLTPEQWTWLTQLHASLNAQVTQSTQLDPLAQSDREEALSTWFEKHALVDGWKLAPGLAEAGLDTTHLENIEEHLAKGALEPGLTWLEATLAIDGLLQEVELSTTRISELVKAIKAYTYMDQARQQEVDIHEGLENTLTILKHKLREGITITRVYDRSLPRVTVYGSELNQVWTNLLDNAIDALQGHGQIWIRTSRAGAFVNIEIADSGSGILPEVQKHIFEPFFTTKEVSKGTGLGLDTAYRIVVTNHHGDLSVVSQPGETRFLICLPLEQGRSA
jgi:signal transduction histidine kinase